MIGGRDRRAMMVGAAIIAAALLLRGIPALRGLHAAERREAVAAQSQLAAARRFVMETPAIRDSLAAASREWETVRAKMFTAPTENALSAEVAAAITSIARGASVELTLMQVRPDTLSSGGIRRIQVKASARGDIRGLASLLSALEGGKQIFAITGMSITQTDAVGRADAPERLGIELAMRTFAIEAAR